MLRTWGPCKYLANDTERGQRQNSIYHAIRTDYDQAVQASLNSKFGLGV